MIYALKNSNIRCILCLLLFSCLNVLFINWCIFVLRVPCNNADLQQPYFNREIFSNLKENELYSKSISNLPYFVKDYLRINNSVHNEIINLHDRLKELLNDYTMSKNKTEHVRLILSEKLQKIAILQSTVISYTQWIKDLNNRYRVFYDVWPTVQIKKEQNTFVNTIEQTDCTLDSCINWNRCLNSRFLRFCLDNKSVQSLSIDENDAYTHLNTSLHATKSCYKLNNEVCFKIIIGLSGTTDDCYLSINSNHSQNSITCIRLLMNSLIVSRLFSKINYQRNIIYAAYSYPLNTFRRNFDFVLNIDYKSLCNHIPGYCSNVSSISLLPDRREVLLAAYLGKFQSNVISAYDKMMIDYFLTLNKNKKNGVFKLSFENIHNTIENENFCWSEEAKNFFAKKLVINNNTLYDWLPCNNASLYLRNSTFGLIFVNALNSMGNFGLRVQLVMCLANGAIPVLLTNEKLDFDEVLDKNLLLKSVLQIPKPRFRELPILLQSISSSDLVEMRRQGQLLLNRHFKDQSTQLQTLLLTLSRRLGFSQPPVKDWPTVPPKTYLSSKDNLETNVDKLHEDKYYSPLNYYAVNKNVLSQVVVDGVSGPIGLNYESRKFRSNYTDLIGSAYMALSSNSQIDLSNVIDPFHLYPSTPWQAVMPLDAAFSSYNGDEALRPINPLMGSTGYLYATNLGGMHGYEQFTIVILTYDRFNVLCSTIEKLLNLPYLNSVIVVWNDLDPPDSTLAWPRIHVPIQVVHSKNNSLNNRFLPYHLIRTDAVFSLDDDVQLRHDEILFGFRLWREKRDQLVGFPARTHAYNMSSARWNYYTKNTCEFSMILTGAVFIHKYYLFIYTWSMPSPIRQMVDKYLNCEDIAMNFLIAHLTRKAPIKVTPRRYFGCDLCKSSLYQKPNHFKRRSSCLTWLTTFYGYNPLIVSQYRADSVLYNIQWSMDYEGCFKYV